MQFQLPLTVLLAHDWVEGDVEPLAAASEQVVFDQAAEALRLPNAAERASQAVSGVRELSPDLRLPIEDRAANGGSAGLCLDPLQAGPEAFPQGSLAPQARAFKNRGVCGKRRAAAKGGRCPCDARHRPRKLRNERTTAVAGSPWGSSHSRSLT